MKKSSYGSKKTIRARNSTTRISSSPGRSFVPDRIFFFFFQAALTDNSTFCFIYIRLLIFFFCFFEMLRKFRKRVRFKLSSRILSAWKNGGVKNSRLCWPTNVLEILCSSFLCVCRLMVVPNRRRENLTPRDREARSKRHKLCCAPLARPVTENPAMPLFDPVCHTLAITQAGQKPFCAYFPICCTTTFYALLDHRAKLRPAARERETKRSRTLLGFTRFNSLASLNFFNSKFSINRKQTNEMKKMTKF